jgi:hypothetical protein
MTDNEIKKVLECCASQCEDACNDCPCVDGECIATTDYVLDLLNRQQAEIERLTERDEIAERIIREQGGAILSLKNKIRRLSEKDEKTIITRIVERNTAIKEFAEKCKKELRTGEIIMDKSIRDIIDNLVKETVGE